MPGYGFADDELQKLFAEAGQAVQKAKVTPPAASPAPVSTPSQEEVKAEVSAPKAPAPLADDDFELSAPAAKPAAPPPAPAGPGGEVRLVGGEQTDAALVARTQAGASVNVPWSQIKGLSLGRVIDKSVLAFVHGGTLYWFGDDNTAYKGLLRQMASTQPMNWRALVGEIAGHVSDTSEAGVQAVTGGGGMVPKYLDMGAFFNAVRAR